MARNHFKKIVIISVLAISSACGSSKVMTREDFYTIELGTPSQNVITNYGEPYSIRNRKDGTQEYLYIERLPVGEETAEQNNYIIVVKNGQVVSKLTKQELPPAYDEIYDDDPNDVPN